MPQLMIPVVAPSYISPNVLPFASDIFYHKRIIYFGPIGSHPIEWHAIAGFPEYCERKKISLPQIIWEMVGAYFENSRLALEGFEILRPLHPEHIMLVTTIYDRNEIAIIKAKKVFQRNRDLLDLFKRTSFDLPFPSRELLSHVFSDLFLEGGYDKSVNYLLRETKTTDKTIELLLAVMINRLRIFANPDSSLLLYDHTWYSFLARVCDILLSNTGTKSSEPSDSDKEEHLCYKIFEAILLPIFGRIDCIEKSEITARISSERSAEISGLKEECKQIARAVITSGTKDKNINDGILRDQIKTRISDPLSALIRKPITDVKQILYDFTLDSGVIGGLIGLVQGTNINTIGVAAAAGALSAGFRYLVSERSQTKTNASKLLIDGMKNINLDAETMNRHLQNISIHNLEIPKEL